MIVIEILFWLAVAAIVMVWLIYPLALWLAATLLPRGRMFARQPVRKVSVVVLAHNEEKRIEARIRNLASATSKGFEYQMVILSDRSTDGTVAIGQRLQKEFANLAVLEARRGKGRASAQNEAIDLLDSDVVMFTDAETVFRPGFVETLAHAFDDPKVGFASGVLHWGVEDNEQALRDFSLYWKLEIFLRRMETKLGICAVGTGACCAVRREAFRPLEPTSDINSATPLDVVQKGYRTVIVPEAEALDFIHNSPEKEFRARVRMTSKNLRDLVDRWDWRRNIIRLPWHSLGLLFHKLGRWLTPYFGLAILLSGAVLLMAGELGTAGMLVYAGGLAGIAVAIAGRFFPDLPLAGSLWNFLNVMIGFGVGVWNWATNRVPSTY